MQDSEAISAHLADLQNQIRASTPPMATVIRVLAEPLSFLELIPQSSSFPQWSGPTEPTAANRLYLIQHLLPNHLDFILDTITVAWWSALPSGQQSALFDAYFVPSVSRHPCAKDGLHAAVAMIALQSLVGILVESLMSTLWAADSKEKSIAWKLALANTTSRGTTQLLLTTLMEYLDRHQLNISSIPNRMEPFTQLSDEEQRAMVHTSAKLLESLGFGIGEPNNVMIEEVLFQGRVFGVGVLRTLICIQTGWPSAIQTDKDSVLAQAVKKAFTIWSDAMFVNHASADYQRYVSHQILLMIPYFDTKVLLDMELFPVFGAGMSNWLELSNFERKRIGLVVAEEFSRAVDTVGSSADFDLDRTNSEIQFARSLVQLKDGALPYQMTAALKSNNTMESGAGNIKTKAISTTTQEIDIDYDDDEDPDAIGDPMSRFNNGDYSSDSSSGEDDEDDLKPYEIEDESDPDEDDVGSIKKTKVAAPLYLRDLLSYMRANEDREKVETGLRTAVELIRRKSGSLELEEFAEQLARTFVLAQDNFDTPNFYKLRENALVALVVTSPVIVAGVLTLEFYEKKNSIGQRMNILTALGLGAQELSGYNQSPLSSATSSQAPPSTPTSKGMLSKDTRATALPAQQNQYSSGSLVTPKDSFASITSSIALERTRRFSQKSFIESSRPAPKANAFSNLAPAFLGGLLGRWGGNRGAGRERGFDVLQRAPFVLMKKYVMTVGVMVHFSGNSPHLLAITREVFQFLLALRYHNPPKSGFAPAGASNSKPQDFMSTIASTSFSEPSSLSSLRLPGDIGSSTPSATTSRSLSSSTATTSLHNSGLIECILFGLLILVTPISAALSDQLLLHEFYPEILECQQWAMELWEASTGGPDEKSRLYCAALLQRCFELLKVSM
ncbi:telomere binding protein [Mortierella polycephala]|uniref:Telomere binding protein n=1 Tax=Mortierella polycephala TaxID=41804 RepID=A0A9P6U5T1_9FUNG|nr:telomere binding protein [Mortierella polycephala]